MVDHFSAAARTFPPAAALDTNFPIVAKLHVLLVGIAGHCRVRPLQFQERFILQSSSNECDIEMRNESNASTDKRIFPSSTNTPPLLTLVLSLVISP
jgi:hypothetical protein